eukprot:gene9491-32474_t
MPPDFLSPGPMQWPTSAPQPSQLHPSASTSSPQPTQPPASASTSSPQPTQTHPPAVEGGDRSRGKDGLKQYTRDKDGMKQYARDLLASMRSGGVLTKASVQLASPRPRESDSSPVLGEIAMQQLPSQAAAAFEEGQQQVQGQGGPSPKQAVDRTLVMEGSRGTEGSCPLPTPVPTPPHPTTHTEPQSGQPGLDLSMDELADSLAGLVPKVSSGPSGQIGPTATLGFETGRVASSQIPTSSAPLPNHTMLELVSTTTPASTSTDGMPPPTSDMTGEGGNLGGLGLGPLTANSDASTLQSAEVKSLMNSIRAELAQIQNVRVAAAATSKGGPSPKHTPSPTRYHDGAQAQIKGGPPVQLSLRSPQPPTANWMGAGDGGSGSRALLCRTGGGETTNDNLGGNAGGYAHDAHTSSSSRTGSNHQQGGGTDEAGPSSPPAESSQPSSTSNLDAVLAAARSPASAAQAGRSFARRIDPQLRAKMVSVSDVLPDAPPERPREKPSQRIIRIKILTLVCKRMYTTVPQVRSHPAIVALALPG